VGRSTKFVSLTILKPCSRLDTTTINTGIQAAKNGNATQPKNMNEKRPALKMEQEVPSRNPKTKFPSSSQKLFVLLIFVDSPL
jgi:hypothetical protein